MTYQDHTSEFQFQYGAIKTNLINISGRGGGLFQFQYGAIKTVGFGDGTLAQNLFQFQYGAIKTLNH